jgi:hypothetical protein
MQINVRIFPLPHVFLFVKIFSSCFLFFFLAARVGRKRGKMNLEKTINKNMFDVSTAIRDSNPLQTSDLIKTDSVDASSTPISSLLLHPKQKLTAQFKRAITMIKQRSEPTNESPSPPSMSLIEKPDSNLLTSLIEEPIHNKLPSPPKSQSFVHIKPSNQENGSNPPTTETIISLDPITLLNQQNQSQSARIIKSNIQQNLTQKLSSSSATLSPTPPTTSSSSSTSTTTGELTILVTNL